MTVSETASIDELLGSNENQSGGQTPKGSVEEDEQETDVSESEEDWDKELEIEEQERGNFLKSSISNIFSASRALEPHGTLVEEGGLPERWVLTKSLAEKTTRPVIVG